MTRKTCVICGNEFDARTKRQIVCSDACRHEYKKRYRLKWHREHPGYMREWADYHRRGKFKNRELNGRCCSICGCELWNDLEYGVVIRRNYFTCPSCKEKHNPWLGDIYCEGLEYEESGRCFMGEPLIFEVWE